MNVRTSLFSYLFFLQACLIKAKLEWNGDIFSSATKKTGRCPQSSKIVSFMQKITKNTKTAHLLVKHKCVYLNLPKKYYTLYWKVLISTRCLCLSLRRCLSKTQTPSDLLRKSSERLAEQEMFVRPPDIVWRIFENFRPRVGIKSCQMFNPIPRMDRFPIS